MPFLSRGLAGNPHGRAVEDGEEAWTYGELARQARVVSVGLQRRGVVRRDRVGLAGPLNRRTLAVLHGIFQAGASVAPLHPGWTQAETGRALAALAPRLLVDTGSDLGRTDGDGVPGGVEAVSADALWEAGGSGEAEGISPRGGHRGPESHDVVAHLLTSGTGGKPGVVGLTAGNLQASAQGSRGKLSLSSEDRWLGSLALAHVGGMALVTRAAFLGSALILRGRFGLPDLLASIQEGTITHASLVPTMLHDLVEAWGDRQVPDSLRCLLIGGAPARGDLVRRSLEAGFPIALTYGLTEAASQVATAPPDLVRLKPGSVGSPLPGASVRVAAGGEILVRGPIVAPGELGDDGWLHTGDLGRQDPEGHLWITGRVSDRIITGGVNVDPVEVEVALEALPGVKEALVLGIPDPRWGERVVAVLVAEDAGSEGRDALQEAIRDQLSPAKRPRALRFVTKLPRNANGKADRERARSLFL